jgi:hypothetical protein
VSSIVSHCQRGHAWTPENTYLRPDNGKRLRSGQFIGLDVEMAADVDAYVQRYPQQTGMDPALYRRQYGPVTP